MEKREALKRYKSQRDIIDQYQDAEQYVAINDDPDLEPIYVPCPKPPEWHLIEGFGLIPKNQKWRIPRMPPRLYEMNRTRTIDDIWDELENDPVKYEEEIEYIKKMWYWRLNGYWFFNNGIPTYVTGKHFFYLTSFRIDSGYPHYYYRDRMYWLFIDFARNHTYDFVHKDAEGRAIKEKDGTYLMKDLGRRVCFGDAYPKMRREGATYRAQCNNLETISKLSNAVGGIQSRTDGDAKKVFTKNLVRPFKKVPFFFKPIFSGSTDPKSELSFDVPSKQVKSTGALASVDVGLESMINFMSGDEGAYDGWKLHFYHDDEVGKNKKNDVWVRHLVSRECLSQKFGYDIHGYTSKTSTVGEMEAGGGKIFEKMCDMSDFYVRNRNGLTLSGLFVFFIPSDIGLINDEHGNPVREESRDIIEAEQKSLLDKDDMEGWLEKVRQYPLKYSDCFSTGRSELGFNVPKITKRYSELKGLDKPKTVRGDFIFRSESDPSLGVEFVENSVNGRYIVSKQLTSQKSCRMKRREDNQWAPVQDVYMTFNVGADPFRFDETEGNRMSDGGIAVKYARNFFEDDEKKSIEEWESDKFVCTYEYRPPTKDDFVLDVLKVCIYYNAMVLAEANVPAVIDGFKRLGFGGYLKYLKDANGKFRKTPGYNTVGQARQPLFNAIRDYIERRILSEDHLELVTDFKDIRSMKEMPKFDRFTACGLAILGEKEDYGYREQEEEEDEMELPFAPKYMD